MTRLLVYPALALSLGIAIAAQSPPAPSFDVVSVKRNNSGGGRMMRNTPGNLSAFNVPIRDLIQMAFQVQDFQIIGAPDWASTEGYDVEGRFDPRCATGGRTWSTADAADAENTAAAIASAWSRTPRRARCRCWPCDWPGVTAGSARSSNPRRSTARPWLQPHAGGDRSMGAEVRQRDAREARSTAGAHHHPARRFHSANGHSAAAAAALARC